MERIIRETCVAGAVVEQIIKGSYKHNTKRKPNSNPTPDAVKNNNCKIAVRKMARKLNANFYPGDYHMVLTYRQDEPGRQEAEKELKNFLRRMSREFKKIDKQCKYIAVTEYKNKRIHHHIVMNYVDAHVIQHQWKRGMVRLTPLDTIRDYTKLAEYLIKETDKTFRDPANQTKQRWTCSRNLTDPIIKREIVSRRILDNDPKPLKGYEIIEESVRRYEHPYTKLEHLELRMISTEPVPRIKTWRKGEIIKRDETYKRAQEIRQLDLESEYYIGDCIWDTK